MKHVVHALAGRTQRLEIEQVGFAKINLGGNLADVLAFAGLKIVEAAHSFAAFQQRANQGRADESGRAGHQIFTHGFKISMSSSDWLRAIRGQIKSTCQHVNNLFADLERSRGGR